MASGLKGVLEQGRALWVKLTPGRRLFMGGVVLGVLALISFLALSTPVEPYEVLFSKLSPEDAGEVVEHLKADKTPYRLEAEGATILVPTARVYELRLSLAQAGLPKGGGVGFEVFDQQSLITTSFVEQTNYQRALQGELTRTISSLAAVESARVHLAMGSRSLFREQDQPPSAAVTLQLKPGKQLTKEQVRGVAHLVASSVDGLTPERVTVLDSRGTLLSADLDGGLNSDAQQDAEKELSRKIEAILTQIVGPGHFAVEVTAEMDHSQVDQTENFFDKEHTAIRGETLNLDGTAAEGNIGGLAGARGNLPGAPAPTSEPAGVGPGERRQETKNYEISHTTTHTIGPKMQLKRLHVAVLIDAASIPKNASSQSTSQSSSQPVLLDPLQQIEVLARQAAGIDDKRGDEIEVRSIPFLVHGEEAPIDEAPRDVLPWWWRYAAGGGALFILLLVWAFSRRKAKLPAVVGLQLLPAKLTALEASLPKGEASVPLLDAPPVFSSRELALEAVRTDTVKAARVLSSWLAESSEGRPTTPAS